MNVVVTGGGTIAPIDDVRLIDQRLLGPVRRVDQRGVAGPWGLGLAHPRVVGPGSAVALRPVARSTRPTPPRSWSGWRGSASGGWTCAIACTWSRSKEGTVADYAATLKAVLGAQPIDVAVLAMAVSDFEPEPYAGKVSSDVESLVVRCRPTPKVIRSVRDWAPSVYLVGFKLLSRASREELIRRAEDACRINRADLTVANDLQTLRQGRHTLHLVRPDAEPETLEPGADLAERLVDRIMTWASIGRGAGLLTPTGNRPKVSSSRPRYERARNDPRAARRTALGTHDRRVGAGIRARRARRLARVRRRDRREGEGRGRARRARLLPRARRPAVRRLLDGLLLPRGCALGGAEAGHRQDTLRRVPRERRIRRPALLHPQRLPDHGAAAPRGGAIRSHCTPCVLDPPHPPDLAAVLPGRLDRVLPAARPRGTVRDVRLSGKLCESTYFRSWHSWATGRWP